MKEQTNGTGAALTLAMLLTLGLSCASPLSKAGGTAIQLELDQSTVVARIDSLTYGANHAITPNIKFRRIGGNRTTGYNWEINSSSAGHDWKHNSDRWLNTLVGLSEEDSGKAAWLKAELKSIFDIGAQAIVTLPMAGYVAADAAGPVTKNETAPSRRWVKVEVSKGNGKPGPGDLSDGLVYVDEQVQHLLDSFGPAGNGGVAFYSLDNEPGLWDSTHPRIHPKPAGYKEVLDQSVALATRVSHLDPQAQFAGAALYGWNAWVTLQNAQDAKTYNAEYGNFANYFLAGMKQASDKAGRRLLHLMDLHVYSEHRGADVRVVDTENIQPQVVAARLQAPRSLWDPTFVETSWITESNGKQPLVILPMMQAAVDKHYPGTRIANLEYNYGAPHHYSGGLAVADALGAYGRYGAASAHWPHGSKLGKKYVRAAFELYLNFDGQGAGFESQALMLTNPNPAAMSTWGARSKKGDRLTLVLINKQAKKQSVVLPLPGAWKSTRAYAFDSKSEKIRAVTGVTLAKETLVATLAPYSATLVEVTP